jgi:hypothetical protein
LKIDADEIENIGWWFSIMLAAVGILCGFFSGS